MKLTISLVVAVIVIIWLYAKWVKSRTLREIEREGNERAADDVRAAIAISEEVDEKSKDNAADELDAIRDRLSKHNSPDS